MQGEPLRNREVEAMAAWHGLPSSGVERFPLVSTVAKFLRVLGFLLVAAGVIMFLAEIAPWIGCTSPAGCPLSYMQIVGAVAALVFGLGIVAVGELLGMFRSIESNMFKLLQVTQEADYKGRLSQG